MTSSSLIPPDRILPDSTTSSKRALLTELATSLSTLDTDQVLEVIMAREHLGSTGIGHGVAIPHGRIPDLNYPVIALVRHPAGIEFESIDGKPVHIVILLLVPDNEDRTHLELLAKLARMLQQQHCRDAILTAESAEAISELFNEEHLQ